MSRGPQRTERDELPASGFDLLLASALRIHESEGDPGLQRLYVEHPEQAPRLRAELSRLQAAGLAGTLAAPDLQSGRESTSPRLRVGAYELLRKLGAGGMGEVYLARQHAPIEREVALKVVRGALPDPAARARFAVERQALSRMQHDGIARVFDAGETDEGVPYFTMEYVHGEPLTRFCDARRLSIRARIELFCRVCDAVQHAHQHGVIHRDLKPDNLLVAEQDGAATPKVIDFGLARPLERAGDEASLTGTGFLLGTVEYMSPEQADAVGNVDTRADVYALGVILFELLVGRVPLPAAGVALLTYLQRLRDEAAPRPSVVARAAAAEVVACRRVGSARALAHALGGDLDWITARALAKQRELRYQSVADLALDLRRHLASEPVTARAPSPWYRVRKFVVRHRAAVAVGAILTLAAVAWLGRELVNLDELRRRDARFDRLALGSRLQRLRDDAEGVPGGAPGFLQAGDGRVPPLARFDAWLAEADALAAERRAFDGAAFAAAVAGDRREFVLVSAAEQLRKVDQEVQVLQQRMRPRRAWAAGIVQATLVDAAGAWRTAIAAIAASPRYGGLQIAPQLGLVPLRENPATGLWEFRFWDPAGEPPQFEADGRVGNGASFDLVFVLLPGGTFAMGSADDDPYAAPTEKPRHTVELAPFFISKYEMTCGQWRRWTGGRVLTVPQTRFHIDDSHPVSHVDWVQSGFELWGHGLRLPTEAQWEYAARAGTTSSWWTGDAPASLSGKANIADAATRRGAVLAPWIHDDVEDGFAMTAPVDALAANAFGLYHVLGNVWEWTSGHYCGNYAEMGGHRPGDGFIRGSDRHPDNEAGDRVARGGSYLSTWLLARSATRIVRSRATASPETGLRPARSLVAGDGGR